MSGGKHPNLSHVQQRNGRRTQSPIYNGRQRARADARGGLDSGRRWDWRWILFAAVGGSRAPGTSGAAHPELEAVGALDRPRSAKGKVRVARNGYKGGGRQLLRALARALRQLQ